MSKEENRVYFSKKDLTFYGDTEKEKKLNEQLFDASLLIAQKDDEIKELNNIINELNNAYCKVITKCEEMKNNRWYMNVNAIKKYAGEIIDICKYYVGEVKELKGDSSNE